MNIYKLDVEMTYFFKDIDEAHDGSFPKMHNWILYFTHEDQYSDEEFKVMCNETIEATKEKWGVIREPVQFTTMLKDKYGFITMIPKGEFVLEMNKKISGEMTI
ncbi:hypothetical protein ACDN41_11690 [Priestia aryabhattai]|uniref:hypothetical protein n=1 Tax=Priestia aryabhattai TaxID=412384 RepID=UPI0035318C52